MQQQRSGLSPKTRNPQSLQERQTGGNPAIQRSANPKNFGHSAQWHGEDQPYSSRELEPQRSHAHSNIQVDEEDEDDYAIEEDEQYYVTCAPRSVVRWDRAPQAPQEYIYRGRRLAVHQGPPPTRRQQPQQFDEYEEEERKPVGRRGGYSWPIILILALLLMGIGWISFNMLSVWWQNTQNDWQYGKSRVYIIDQVVNHNHDSTTNPSHFIAQNSNGDIVVTEWPAGDLTKAINYQIDTIPGNQGNPPVTLIFQDYDHDGKVDLLVQIGNAGQQLTVILLNNGTKFVPATLSH